MHGKVLSGNHGQQQGRTLSYSDDAHHNVFGVATSGVLQARQTPLTRSLSPLGLSLIGWQRDDSLTG